jgi:regulatory protein
MPPAPLSLKGRALRLLSMREYSRLELERRLQPFEEEPGALARILDDLEAKGFISAQRVLESVLHRKSTKLGVLRLRQELQNKGLPADAVQEAVGQLHATEIERARAIWRKKFGAAPTNPAERAKQMRFLAGRGFSGDTIQRVVRGADDDGGI